MSGSTAFEVLSVILPSILLVFICTTFTTIFYSKLENTTWRYLCDFCIVAAPQIFNVTVLVPHMKEVYAFIAFVSVSLTVLAHLNRKGSKYKCSVTNGDKKNFITNVRSTINLLTIVAILAVDFKIFPQQLKKQLTYGYSLMDVGVGLFVYANAIVAAEIKNQSESLKKTIVDTIPLIVLGIGRYVATTVTDYNVSITEYGKHWNFFITLAFTRIISSILLTRLPLKFSALYGVAILALHEAILQLGLAEYVLSGARRDNVFSANREGITSISGFVALYFLSVAAGMWMNLKDKGATISKSLLVKFLVATVILLPATFVLEHRFGLSRRLANSAYCVWILFVGVFTTGLFYLVETFQAFLYEKCGFTDRVFAPFLLDAINYNGLIYFLLANILTGFVNMSCQTLSVSPINSLIILIAYVNVTSIAISVLYVQRINLKSIIRFLTEPKKTSYNV